MPPRFAYWTIILDGAPTSFRARGSGPRFLPAVPI